jgi:enoyl-CoA hydratase/carnithine racemase
MIETVWLDNPPVNAVNGAIVDTITGALHGLEPSTRVLVLRGLGEKAFSAGADISGFGDGPSSARVLQQTCDLIEQAPVPVVAAIHGFCLGGGLELALACDVRVARSDAQLGFPEVRLGLLPGGGGTQRAPRLIGPGRTAWLVMSGERIDAAQAERWGLVEFVVDDLDAGVEHVAGTLAKQSRAALRRIKEVLRETRDARDDSVEYAAFREAVASDDGREGVAAFLEKRAPNWSD